MALVKTIRLGMATAEASALRLKKSGDMRFEDKMIGLFLHEIGGRIRQSYGQAFKKELDRYSNLDLVQFYISAGFDREVEELISINSNGEGSFS
ncbi:hypothetical protein [Cohnella sp. AR92]|uniref:hypothetical protein n=1 Tax=Cohnella sp. AR92 TaxID=648716 RepID=UPI000F8D9F40|nr:hypothetical protein [Cohnella sp. AR92]RUS47038.1 hypothetical protein ELR57_11590 [Cohnella sp. AR92]